MNEVLIQKLVDQSVVKKERYGRIVEVLQSRKFAELIVRQMLEITDAHTEVFQTDRDKTLIEHIKQSVKQHFGVEE